MNILQIANKVPYPPKDGGSIATWNMTEGFVKEGNTVTITAINTSKHYVEMEQLPVLKNIRFCMTDLDTKIRPLKALKNLFFSDMPYNAERFIHPAFEQLIVEQLKMQTFEVIQIEGLYLIPYIPAIRKYSDALIAYRAHNVEHQIWERTLALQTNPLKKKYLKILAQRIKAMEIEALNQYDVLVPITQRDAGILNALGNTKPVFVSPAGITMPAKTAEKTKVEFPSLFHLGALDWSPNQEGLLWFLKNCWKGINKQYPNLKFYIAGRNAPKWFQREIKYKNVVFCGEVENAAEFIKSKAVMIVPLLSGSGMRIKIVEGMAYGKTIVTTSIGTEGIDTKHNENILIANSPEEFIDEINKLLTKKTAWKKIGENAENFVRQNYDNAVLCRNLLEFYDQQK